MNITEDITVEQQREYDKQMLHSAKKGELIVKVISIIYIIGAILNLVVDDGRIVLRIVSTGISVWFTAYMFFRVALNVACAGAYGYFLYFNQNVDCFFKYKNAVRHFHID